MLFSAKPESRLSLVFEIGSGSVGAALVSLSRSGKPKILSTLREPMPFQETVNPKRLAGHMIAALEKACAAMRKEAMPRIAALGKDAKIAEASVAFCPPWYLSETRQITIEKIKPFALTKEIAGQALSGEAAAFEKRENVEEGGAAELDREIVGAVLDGYPARNPIGKRASKAELSAYLSFTSKAVLASVREAILKSFSPREIFFSAFPLAEYRVLRDKILKQEEFVMISVCREVTELTLVKKGVLQETASFPIGKNRFVREIMKASGSPAEVAASELETYFKEAGSAEHSGKTAAAIEAAAARWKSDLRESLEHFADSHYLPGAFCILTQPAFSAFFNKQISEADASSETLAGENPKLIALDPELFKKEFEGDADADSYLMIAALAAAMRFADPEV